MSPKAQVDDHVDPSPETSSQLPPSDPFPLPAAATYSPIEIEQLAPGPLQNGPIDTAPNSSSHPSTGSIETPYDPTHVTPSGSSFIKPIQRNLPAEPPTNHDPSIDKTTKTERDVTIHTCSSDHRTVTAITEHLLFVAYFQNLFLKYSLTVLDGGINLPMHHMSSIVQFQSAEEPSIEMTCSSATCRDMILIA
ncbi:hypothetical protein BGZ63DRAFT_51767 [Mariannaea sp. PMI_226]|nr:hypothetical protein BGZ63DRAFT_51767 [Mariannaea sp. PMI_226]